MRLCLRGRETTGVARPKYGFVERESSLSEIGQHIWRSLARFGMVGVIAVSVQAFLFVVLAGYVGVSGFAANTVAYAVSLLISYFGQSCWTFSDRKKRSISKFLILVFVLLMLGSVGSWVVCDLWGLSSAWMLPIILLVIPGTSFVMMDKWVFTHVDEDVMPPNPSGDYRGSR